MLDIAVVGGGIAGLYTAYHYLKTHPGRKVVVLERSSHELGGRVQTYHDPFMDVEMGAGRIQSSHKYVMRLIRELGLKSRLVEIGKETAFMSVKRPGEKIHSIMDLVSRESLEALGISGNKNPSMPFDEIISLLLKESRTMSKHHLQSMTFIEYAKSVVGDAMVKILIDTFGYYSEIVIMNAYDSLRLMRELDPKNRFFALNGGLSLIVERLATRIHQMGGEIIMEQKVVSIQKLKKPVEVRKLNRGGGGARKTRKMGATNRIYGFHITCANGSIYWAKRCVCALPKQSIEKLEGGLFRSILPDLEKIECGTLCRIYSQFDKAWFRDLGKLTVDNDLRMIIPIDLEKGIVMISYSDNKWADKWHDLYRSEGIGAVNRRLKDLVYEATGIRIPLPKHTQVFYWPCGVGYWKKGADSEEVEKRVVEPCPGLFVCGEHYSSGHQQWMEGALETSRHVLSRLYNS